MAHHGSLAREQRVVIEDRLKRGELRAIVATSSLELGIDMGAVDLVIQVESPGAVSRGLQRIGRAGHSVGEPRKGRSSRSIAATWSRRRSSMRRMIDGDIESTRFLRNPLDVLAAADRRPRRDRRGVLGRGGRGAGPAVRELRRDQRRSARQRARPARRAGIRARSSASCDPRIVWDRVNDRVRARDGAKRLAVTSGGTIPDRGLFGVFLPDGTRVGELDEEMVYESRAGRDLRARRVHWRIEDITSSGSPSRRRPASRARCRSGTATGPGRPLELGRALGAFSREIHDARRRRRSNADDRLLARRVRGEQRRSCTSTSRPRRPASCRTTGRSSSSGSRTRSATGGCAS